MIIYKTTNLVNGKIYIGQDFRNKQNYFGSGNCLHRAIRKYGLENFKKEILEYCKTKEQLNEQEIFWIKKLNSKVPNGYNLTDGGGGSINPSKETRKKMSKAHGGKKFTKVHKESISEGLKGKKFTKAHKEKMSKARKGRALKERGHRENCLCSFCFKRI